MKADPAAAAQDDREEADDRESFKYALNYSYLFYFSIYVKLCKNLCNSHTPIGQDRS